MNGSIILNTVHGMLIKLEENRFRVFRTQKRVETNPADIGSVSGPVQEPVNDAATFDTDWCDDADDWGDDSDGVGGDQDAITQLSMSKEKSFAAVVAANIDDPGLPAVNNTVTRSNTSELEHGLEQLSLLTEGPLNQHQVQPSSSKPVSAWSEVVSEPVTNDDNVPEFVSYFINVFDEPSAMSEDLLTHEHQLMKEYQEREGVSLSEWQEYAEGKSGSRGGNGEGYEKVTAKHGDRTFEKFIKKIQTCPGQCIRYCYGGEPLWMTDSNQRSTNIQACPHCGSKRLFEFQLMPALLPSLQFLDQQAPPIDFGVIAIFTCSRSCWTEECSDMLREEALVIQHDPDSNAIIQAEQKLKHLKQSKR
ncbi:programmed cell death protein 2-like isoform X2 [Lytechinus variegatus]|uniref:programmed cell death protein 2-like isoform X2 n=1 Tax=Lytechinus variegatus TaxID=7654 RepID=UPI001BB2BE10|nr:programmed cell death protein 2-like isoform X2 [Lytechinus variegatus]